MLYSFLAHCYDADFFSIAYFGLEEAEGRRDEYDIAEGTTACDYMEEIVRVLAKYYGRPDSPITIVPEDTPDEEVKTDEYQYKMSKLLPRKEKGAAYWNALVEKIEDKAVRTRLIIFMTPEGQYKTLDMLTDADKALMRETPVKRLSVSNDTEVMK